jgi:hypothetical protein
MNEAQIQRMIREQGFEVRLKQRTAPVVSNGVKSISLAPPVT